MIGNDLIVAGSLLASLKSLGIKGLGFGSLLRGGRAGATAAADVAKIVNSLGFLPLNKVLLHEDQVSEAILTDVVLKLFLLTIAQIIPIRMVAVEHSAGLEFFRSAGNVELVHLAIHGKFHPDVHNVESLPGLGSGHGEAG